MLLSFRLNDYALIGDGVSRRGVSWFDKVPRKFAGWGEAAFRAAGFRAVPGSVVRSGSFVAPSVVLMPSFVNIGAYVDERHDGRHLGDGRQLRADRQERATSPAASASAACWSRCRRTRSSSRTIASSAPARKWSRACVIGKGSVLSMGVFIGPSTKIVDRATGQVFMGHVPPYSVVVPGSLPGKPLPDGTPGPSLYCAVIVKSVDEQTRAKTAINELLRD